MCGSSDVFSPNQEQPSPTHTDPDPDLYANSRPSLVTSSSSASLTRSQRCLFWVCEISPIVKVICHFKIFGKVQRSFWASFRFFCLKSEHAEVGLAGPLSLYLPAGRRAGGGSTEGRWRPVESRDGPRSVASCGRTATEEGTPIPVAGPAACQ